MAHQSICDEYAALAAMLRSLGMMLHRGPGDSPEVFFDVLRAMLFSIDEFAERLHRPKESQLLFPRVGRMSPAIRLTIDRLEMDHTNGEATTRELQHMLLAWALVGES
jgi:hemerythrin-like domain-containing protein